MTLEISLLGPYHVARDESSITDSIAPRERALLAYLAVEGQRTHPREALAELLWPDRPQKSALSNLRGALPRLRRAIGDREAEPPYFIITPRSLRINPDAAIVVDVERFETLLAENAAHRHRNASTCPRCLARLERAMALYRGPFLDGLSLGDCPEYDIWMHAIREGLHQRAVQGLSTLAGYEHRRGRLESARGYAERQVALDPWLERAHRQLVAILYELGERGAALRQYETCRRILEEDLGALPTPDMQALAARIQAGEPPDATASADHDLPAPFTPFLGREEAQAKLLERLVDPESRLITLTGPGGIGKTRLATELARTARHQFPDGVCMVELDGLSDPAHLEGAVADAMDLCEALGQDLGQALRNHLRNRSMLLLLDNCEHLLSRLSRLAEVLLRASPRLCILATSREALGLPGEILWPLEALDLPSNEVVMRRPKVSG